MSDKYCVNCRFYDDSSFIPTCSRTRYEVHKRDMVTGLMLPEVKVESCNYERQPTPNNFSQEYTTKYKEIHCGEEGQFFKQKGEVNAGE